MFSVEQISKARELAKAIKEEAVSGEIDSHILIWHLAAAVEELAAGLAFENDSEPCLNRREGSEQVCVPSAPGYEG